MTTTSKLSEMASAYGIPEHEAGRIVAMQEKAQQKIDSGTSKIKSGLVFSAFDGVVYALRGAGPSEPITADEVPYALAAAAIIAGFLYLGPGRLIVGPIEIGLGRLQMRDSFRLIEASQANRQN